jgi:hypothetical protein
LSTAYTEDAMPLPITVQDFIYHFDRAKALIDAAPQGTDPHALLAEAQVHATLAQTAAVWLTQQK